jgi:hypothetical protein
MTLMSEGCFLATSGISGKSFSRIRKGKAAQSGLIERLQLRGKTF